MWYGEREKKGLSLNMGIKVQISEHGNANKRSPDMGIKKSPDMEIKKVQT